MLPVTEDEGLGVNVTTGCMWNISCCDIYLSCLNVKEMVERRDRKLHCDGQTNGFEMKARERRTADKVLNVI